MDSMIIAKYLMANEHFKECSKQKEQLEEAFKRYKDKVSLMNSCRNRRRKQNDSACDKIYY